MMDSVFVAMDLVRVAVPTEDFGELPCTRCYAPLDLHQLDIHLPGRMLATCAECKAWYLIDVEESLMALLPDESDLRNA